jgi:hypothetical protein
VPFDPDEQPSELAENEKQTVVLELSKCEPDIRAGNLELLELVLEICSRCQIPAPVWALPYAIEAINKLVKLRPRDRQRMMQREIHQIRWATVHHLRVSQALTWDAAYEAATKELQHTCARGSEDTIRASYIWMNRHPFIKSMRQHGLPREIDAFAREQYEKRHITSERLAGLALRDAGSRRPRK